MPRYALVEFATMTVINVENRSSVLPAPNGFRNIVETDWTPGDDPMVGDIWDGAIPAGFAPPPPPADLPEDVPTAVANVRLAQAELDRRMNQLDDLLGTSA